MKILHNGAKYQKSFLGNFGDIGTYSFDFAKTLTTGEGGMIVFKKRLSICKVVHDHGHENNPKP